MPETAKEDVALAGEGVRFLSLESLELVIEAFVPKKLLFNLLGQFWQGGTQELVMLAHQK